MKAIVLAAGYATRLYPLTLNTPKPLLEIGGRTILDHLLDRFTALETLDAVYIVTNKKFAPHFHSWAERAERRFALRVFDDGTDSNETRLGAIADVQFVIEQARLDDDLVVAAGDNVFQNDFTQLYRYFCENQTDLIFAQRIDDPVRLRQRGVVEFDHDHRVIGFEEKPANPRSEYVCPALYLHRRVSVPMYRQYLDQGGNPDAPGHFIRWLYPRAPLAAFVLEKPAIDIGTLEAYDRLLRQMSA